MKKIGCILLGVLLLVALAVPALAVSGSVSLGTSAATVYRGDTFTVTATLNSSDAIALGTVKLSFDASALELTGGSCHVSGVAVGHVIAGSNAGTFLLSGDPAVISGKIFTFNFKVKDGAGFGSYQISSNASIGVDVGQSISSGSVTVSVACRHSYENCTKADEVNHVSTCKFCADQKTEAHTWNAGTVITAATCKDPGSKKLTCTGCGATKEEPIPTTDGHQYGAWSANGSLHNRTCALCQKVDVAEHTWNNGTVITAATCTSAGSKQQTCTACSATRTVAVAQTAHEFGPSAYVDDQGHKHSCKRCGTEVTEAHQYGQTLAHDENWHFLRCEGCGHEKDQSAHVPGPEATETTDQICTVCNRILKPMGKHVHNFGAEWASDGTGHWHGCDSCNEKDSAAPHVFDDDCDSACNVCSWERQPDHLPAAEMTADESGHWYACTACGEKLKFAAHMPGLEATITSAQTCTLCGFEIAPILPHAHVFDAEGTFHSHSCACGEVYSAQAGDCQVCAGFPWKWVCIAEAAVFGLVIILVLLLKKRRY